MQNEILRQATHTYGVGKANVDVAQIHQTRAVKSAFPPIITHIAYRHLSIELQKYGLHTERRGSLQVDKILALRFPHRERRGSLHFLQVDTIHALRFP